MKKSAKSEGVRNRSAKQNNGFHMPARRRSKFYITNNEPNQRYCATPTTVMTALRSRRARAVRAHDESCECQNPHAPVWWSQCNGLKQILTNLMQIDPTHLLMPFLDD